MTHDTSEEVPASKRVLFVDDSRLMRFAANRFLRQEFDVVQANNGRQASRLLMSDPTIGVVITDLIMPELDGFELIRRIRSARDIRIRSLPILAVSSMEEQKARRMALDAGANDLVPKPFSGSDLVEPARQYLARASQARARPSHPANVRVTRSDLVGTLEQVASYHDRIGQEYALLHLRVDNHAAIASRYGARWAESLMRHVERVVAREIRLEDSLGRSAEDVLTMVLMSTGATGAKCLRDRLREHLVSHPARYPGTTLAIQASFSVQCPDPKRHGDGETILREGLERLAQPANVTRLVDRVSA